MKESSITIKAGIILFWILLWQLIAMAIGSPLIIATPIQVAVRLFALIFTKSFWVIVSTSFVRIIFGLVLALMVGFILATVCYKSKWAYLFLYLPLSAIKAIPVASFIILVLLWINSDYLSTLVGFLIVLPLVFENIYNGLNNVDGELIQMSEVFHVPTHKRIKYLYFDQLLPAILTSIGVGVGFCFKSGVAAEVIGICKNTIGEAIYMAKLMFETVDVLAWTVVIVILSSVTQKVAKGLTQMARKGSGYDKIN